MMQKQNILHLLLGAALLTGCSADMDQGPNAGGIPIDLGYNVVTATDQTDSGMEQTRAATNLNNDQLTSGTVVAVSVKKSNGGTYTTAYNYTAAATGVLSPATANQFCYEVDGSSSDIIAYYPATAANVAGTPNLTSAVTFSVQTNQTTDPNYQASDLMWAQQLYRFPAYDKVTLPFIHKLSKIIVNASAGSGVTSITSVTLNNVKPKVDFTASDGTVTLASSDNTATSITMSNEGAAIIPPQTINGEFITIVTPEGTAVYAVENKEFESGHQYTLNITVNDAAIGDNNTITGWTSEGTVNVLPNMEVANFDVADHAPDAAVAVDLGLPSGTKWANMNVGASAETDYGTYFAWGETIGYTVSGSTDTAAANNQKTTDHSWDYYWWGSSTDMLTKYVSETAATYCGLNGFYDNKTQLELANDAARVNWGGNWRMPTREEIVELLDNTTDTWQTNYNGVSGCNGYVFTSKTDATKSIFLPAAGYRFDSYIEDQGSCGCYWSSSLDDYTPYFVYGLGLDSSYSHITEGDRHLGYSVRAVCEE